jgi:hypothetical protein
MKQEYGSHNHRSIRSKGYNNSIAGAYFATICAHNREYISGDVLEDEMVLNELGKWCGMIGIIQEICVKRDD